MKRSIIIAGVVVAMLGGGGAALAASNAFNTYTASATFSASAAGSPKHPAPIAFHEVWGAQGTNGHEAAPIMSTVAKIYGYRTNGKDFPVCTAKMIDKASAAKGWNKVCPKGSLIAQGPVNSLLVPASEPSGEGASPCNPYLTVYNGGKDTQVFFFEETPSAPSSKYTCAGGAVPTGSAPPYTGHITEPSSANHNTWTVSIPLPPAASTKAGGLPGLYASLIKLDLKYAKLTRKVHGKTVAYGESIGCKNGTRPYSYTFKAQNYEGQSPASLTKTVSGTAACS